MEPNAELQKPVEEAMEKLTIDATKQASNSNLPATKEACSSDVTSCISSGDASNTVKESEVNQEGSVGGQGMYYYGYYYPGWDDNLYFVGTNGLEVHPSVVQGDNAPYLCYLPGYENGYVSYSPFISGAMAGADGQYIGQQPYYSSAVLPQSPNSPGVFAQPVAYGPELVPAYTWDPSYVLLDGVRGHSVSVDQTNSSARRKYNNHAVLSSKASSSTKSLSDMKGSPSALDLLPASSGDDLSSKPINKASGAALAKGYLPTKKLSVHTNQGKGGPNHSKGINLKENGRSWNSSEKLKATSKVNGFADYNISYENGRTINSKNGLNTRVDLIGTLSRVKVDDGIPSTAAVSKVAYNLPDFVTKYEQALFFVIKSYSEDDIHKSIKYNVWASTPNGNKRLDNAFKVAQERVAEKGTKCPVFLFFSVNASGQFCGVAEMVGPVDFNTSMDFWQQDKWNGFFPVKWHIIKDVPNPQFRHIILENNENKPVTNSRDTQEVKFPQGTEMLNVFKTYSCKTSILDDFEFYENRQKVMQDRRSKPLITASEHPSPITDKPAEVKDESQLSSYRLSTEVGTGNKNEEECNELAENV